MRFRLSQAALASGFLILFLVVNRAAYQGYFSDDDLDNLTNTMLAGFDTFWRGFGSVTYDLFNFRPVGHVIYRWMGQAFGLWFAPYVILIQVLHLLNVFLVYLFARTTLDGRAGAMAAVFFAFHPALLAAHWKPMYLFDLLCGTALMAAYLLYRRGWWIGSLFLFWCAYKSKEIAILFPLVLLWEEGRHRRKWLRLAPFFGVSLNFGLQALIANRARPQSAYTLQLTGAALWECVRFYGRASWGLPWFLLATWHWIQDCQRKWLWTGVLAATILMGPLFILPGRLFAVYLYVPLMFGSIAVAAVLGRVRTPLLVAFAVAYAAIGLQELRAFRRAELTQAQSTRVFVEAACAALKNRPRLTKAFYENGPEGLNVWGTEGALRLCSGNLQLALQPWDLRQIRNGDTVIRWVKPPGAAGFLEVSAFTGELSGDWFAWDRTFRWMGAEGVIRLKASSGDRHLVIDLLSAPAEEVEVLVDGRTLGIRRLVGHGEQQLTFDLPTALAAGEILVKLRARPARQIGSDPRELGLAVRAVRTAS